MPKFEIYTRNAYGEGKGAEPKALGRIELADGVDAAEVQRCLRAGDFKFEPAAPSGAKKKPGNAR